MQDSRVLLATAVTNSPCRLVGKRK
uniref:Uncharacterized protein n=1 Tax=Anguilla anguilla TaxID=7936 RepID=A0A0E9Q9J0_ANGAN